MRARYIKNGTATSITGISNESMLETVNDAVEAAGCNVEFKDCHTKAEITGTPVALKKFEQAWNQD